MGTGCIFIDSWEKAACFCVNLLSFTKAELDRFPQFNTLYISVYGLSVTTYTINVHILRSIVNEGIHKEVLLYDGLS
jgi:hypothetical protein